MTCLVEGELKYAMEQYMRLCVLMGGTTLMLQWCAESLDSLLTVHNSIILPPHTFLLLHMLTYKGAIPLGSDVFRSRSQHDRFPGRTNITCTGSELRLSDCSYEQQIGDCETAAIICQSELAILM